MWKRLWTTGAVTERLRRLLLRVAKRLDHHPGTSRLEVDVDALGRGTILLDGRDLSMEVRGLTIRARAGDLTTVTLELPAVCVRVHAYPDHVDVDSPHTLAPRP